MPGRKIPDDKKVVVKSLAAHLTRAVKRRVQALAGTSRVL